MPAYGANGILCRSKQAFRTKPSIIVGRKGSAGEVNLTEGPFWPTDVTYFVEYDERVSDLRYLFYALKLLNLQKLAKGVKPGVNRNDVYALKIPMPPLPEQKRIVVTLDEGFEGIEAAVANAEKNLANARELFEIYLNSVFLEKGVGRTEKSFSEICEITSRLVDPREPEFIDLLHLGAGNIVSLTGEVVDVKTAREEGLKSGKFLFDSTMVLYSKIRPYLMKACRPEFSGLCSADVYPLLPNQQHLDRDFLFYMLMSRGFTDYAIAGSDRAGMPKVNRDYLFRYKTWLPPVAEQKQLASKLDSTSGECRRLEAIYLQKLASLGELKQVILHKAFAGELTTRDVQTVREAAE